MGPIRPIALCVLAYVSFEAFAMTAASAASQRGPILPPTVTVPTTPTPAASVPTSLARARGNYSSAQRFRPWEIEVADDGTVTLTQVLTRGVREVIYSGRWVDANGVGRVTFDPAHRRNTAFGCKEATEFRALLNADGSQLTLELRAPKSDCVPDRLSLNRVPS